MKIGHIALYTKDLEQAASFFETYFEGKRNTLYQNIHTAFSSYFLSFEDGTRLELMNLPALSEAPLQASAGYAHIAFQVGSKEKVDSLTARLEQDGYEIKSYPRVTGDGYYESCVYDKEHNSIEITI